MNYPARIDQEVQVVEMVGESLEGGYDQSSERENGNLTVREDSLILQAQGYVR
jgi:hypothetical protein